MLQAHCAGASALSVGAMSGLACRIEGFPLSVLLGVGAFVRTRRF